ncbi:hypothetical protein GA0070604_0128 [Micromonospora eburnea]|uniref:Uncharacterized protein n=1 Tax=Micromonospora eburnea TaxID=227316 RepID=A0A1C6TQE4_9ACTN|nr:hypothetical protein GA0070604_0128 [Micromonospora eburnea]
MSTSVITRLWCTGESIASSSPNRLISRSNWRAYVNASSTVAASRGNRGVSCNARRSLLEIVTNCPALAKNRGLRRPGGREKDRARVSLGSGSELFAPRCAVALAPASTACTNAHRVLGSEISPSSHRPVRWVDVLGRVTDMQVARRAAGHDVRRIIAGHRAAARVVRVPRVRPGQLGPARTPMRPGHPIAPAVRVRPAPVAVAPEHERAHGSPPPGAPARPACRHDPSIRSRFIHARARNVRGMPGLGYAGAQVRGCPAGWSDSIGRPEPRR